ncbi:MAG: sigma-54 interaction domain-containing protein [Bacillota bacterium]
MFTNRRVLETTRLIFELIENFAQDKLALAIYDCGKKELVIRSNNFTDLDLSEAYINEQIPDIFILSEPEFCRTESLSSPEPIYLKSKLNLGRQDYGWLIFCLLEKQEKDLQRLYRNVNTIKDDLTELILNQLIEQVLAEKNKDQNQHMNLMLENLPGGIIAADAQGIVTLINQKAEKITGFDKSRVVGKRLLDIFSGSELLKVLDQGLVIQRKEIICMTPQGKKRLILAAAPIKDGLDIQGVIAILTPLEEVKSYIDLFFAGEVIGNKTELIGKSPAFMTALEKAKQVACSSSSIMIRGESGTGKELFARTIHQNSMRKDYNFVAINCAAIPGELLESELFGYESGAFTGAKKGGKPGKFEMANRGTIFLDEIGDMPLDLQAKILKVIQEKAFYRIGGTEEINVDVRIITATNKNLESLIRENKFRKDLFFRINVIPIHLPPLRERLEDIKPLAEHFISLYNRRLKKEIEGLTEKALAELKGYDFPGNVRELENMIEYALNMENSSRIRPENLSFMQMKAGGTNEGGLNLEGAVSNLEKKIIEEALEIYGRSTAGKLEAAARMGISKTTLYKKLNKYQIDK